jgi:hypothetical protein
MSWTERYAGRCKSMNVPARGGFLMFTRGKRAALATAVAACGLMLSSEVVVAQQQQKRQAARTATPNAQQVKCLQQAGAGIDPVTKKWMFYVTEGDAMSRIDALKMCLAGGDRKRANAIGIPELPMTHPGDRGPRGR